MSTLDVFFFSVCLMASDEEAANLPSSQEEELEQELQAVLEGRQPKPKSFVNDEVGILQKLEEIKLKFSGEETVPWDETLAVTSRRPLELKNVHDDLEREPAFYALCKGNVDEAIEKLEKAAIPWKRPNDYFAEMIKSDDHMMKVKQKRLEEKAQLEKAEKVRQLRREKKIAKQVQQERQIQKKQQQKANQEAVKLWRKARKKSGESGVDDEFPLEVLDSENPATKMKETLSKTNAKATTKKSWKRIAKDKKYGYGGKKRGLKRNDAESSADLSSFSVAKNKRFDKSWGIKTPKRPGKRARQQKLQQKRRKRQRVH